jgi:hypothetical protein
VVDERPLHLEFVGELWHWRGPAPYHFVTVPEEGCAAIKAIANDVSYGWGMIPVHGRIGATEFDTSLWPKDGRYLVPIRDVVRLAEGLELGADVAVELRIRSSTASRRKPADDVEYDMDHGPPDA